MARGRFGRRRSAGGNMAALVQQLLREQRQAEDKAMFDAWQNGGEYKGKPVDDDRLLAYIGKRRDGFSRSDPLWDQWNNTLTQYRFSIGEQKIQLAFREGRVGAGAVASFYRSQLKGLPKDSAFYRDVASRAAQWAQSAAGAARGRARASATKGLRDKLNGQLIKQQEFLALEQALTEYAKREGIISGTQTLSDADATALQGMFDRGLYAGETRITFEDFRTAAQDHYKAIGSEIETRQALGQQATEAINKRKKFLTGTVVRLNAVDERVQYEMAREAWLEDVARAGGNPWAIQAANADYLKALQGVHANASAETELDANDPEFIGGLANEFNAIAEGKSTGKTVADLYDMDDDAGSGQDQAEATAQLLQDIDDISSGKAYFGQTEPGGAFEVVQWPQGGPSALGLDDSLQPMLTTVNGEKQVVYLKGQAVKASVIKDAASGDIIDMSDPSVDPGLVRQALLTGQYTVESSGTAGYVFTDPTTRKVTYGVRDAQGNLVFTEANPFNGDPTTLDGADLSVLTSQVDPSGRVLAAAAVNRPVSIDNGFDPLMSDSTVAPKDLLAFAANGLKDLTEDDLVAYRARLERQNQAAFALQQQRAGERNPNLIPGNEQTISDPRDVRSPVAQQIAAGSQALRSAFVRDIDRPEFTPPPAPKATIKPPTRVEIDDVFKPPKPVVEAPEVEFTDRGEEGRGGGGSWADEIGRGAGGSWGDDGLDIGTGKIGGGGR